MKNVTKGTVLFVTSNKNESGDFSPDPFLCVAIEYLLLPEIVLV